MGEFVKEFLSENNAKVNSPTVIATIITVILAALAIPVTILGMCAIYHHVWTLKKGLDGSAAQVIIALAGGGGVGMGVGYAASRFARGPVAMAKPAPPEGPTSG